MAVHTLKRPFHAKSIYNNFIKCMIMHTDIDVGFIDMRGGNRREGIKILVRINILEKTCYEKSMHIKLFFDNHIRILISVRVW